MFPFFRLILEFMIAWRRSPLALGETHVSHHRCWPWDVDFMLELNNGRTLTLLDLGRMPLAMRGGLLSCLRRERWGMTMAGVTVRYRRRILPFERFTMKSRALCWDARFIYLEQCMVKRSGEVANHALYRVAITDANGLVGTDRFVAAMRYEGPVPEIPAWIETWITAENERPWPPMLDA
jgi:acyl-CoA thioesterase FadM